jgi:hypothetical protein
MKQFLAFSLIALFLASCGNNQSNNLSTGTDGASVKAEFAALIENPDNFVDKNIQIEGKVVHVCTHTGKKMFIVGANPDIRLYIEAGEETSKFPMDLLGSEISVEGKLTRLTSPEKPAEQKAPETGAAMVTATGEACETEAAVNAQPVLADMVLAYKSHTVK